MDPETTNPNIPKAEAYAREFMPKKIAAIEVLKHVSRGNTVIFISLAALFATALISVLNLKLIAIPIGFAAAIFAYYLYVNTQEQKRLREAYKLK